MSLGEDLETEILVRLPAKSLMRFKCVQRSWNVLFKTPPFVTRHVHMCDDRALMILDGLKPRVTLLSCDDDPTPACTLISPAPDNSRFVQIFLYGHCNGVFLFQGSRSRYAIDDQFILWNPTTREVHLVPPPPSHYHPIQFCGFGADPNTNHFNFKVVNLNVYHDNGVNSSAEIYNLSTKSWTLIHPLALPFPDIILHQWPSKYNSLVNGVYHWITGHSQDGVANILCFDFRNNRFHNLTAPTSPRIVFDWDDIAEVSGSLGYVAESHYGLVRLEIWVMHQSGWAKKYSIGPIGPMVRVCGTWKDFAQVLGSKGGQPLTSYDHDGNPVRQFQIDMDCESCFQIHEYVQSIAPLST